MKKKIIYSLIIICLTCLSCKAQITQIVPIETTRVQPEYTYFKDLNNLFNKYEGSWKYENGNTSFTIILEKNEESYDSNFKHYFDVLTGEYNYIENGTTIVNTLPLLTQNPNNINNRNIGGGYIANNDQVLVCDDCAPGEKRVKLYFNDPERDYLNPSLILQMVQEENTLLDQEGIIKVTLIGTGGFIPNENSPTETRVPYGEYMMIKQ